MRLALYAVLAALSGCVIYQTPPAPPAPPPDVPPHAQAPPPRAAAEPGRPPGGAGVRGRAVRGACADCGRLGTPADAGGGSAPATLCGRRVGWRLLGLARQLGLGSRPLDGCAPPGLRVDTSVL